MYTLIKFDKYHTNTLSVADASRAARKVANVVTWHQDCAIFMQDVNLFKYKVFS